MIEWLLWLPNNVLDTLTDNCSTPPSLKILQQRVHELAGGGGGRGYSEPPFFYYVVGNKRFKSERVKFSKAEGADNF